MLHFKLKGQKYRPTRRKKLILHKPLGLVERSCAENVQISIFFIELGTKIVDRFLIMFFMIP